MDSERPAFANNEMTRIFIACFARAGGGEIHLPGDLAGGIRVILFNCGSWCLYCNAQLAAFRERRINSSRRASKSSQYRWTIGKRRRRSLKSTSSASRSPAAPMRERFPQSPAPSSMTIPSTSRQPASSSIPKAGAFLSSSCAMYELLSGLTARTLRHQLCKPRRQ
jgi:hypothetical protein